MNGEADESVKGGDDHGDDDDDQGDDDHGHETSLSRPLPSSCPVQSVSPTEKYKHKSTNTKHKSENKYPGRPVPCCPIK